MTDITCSIEGCDKARYARGWCVLHYSRWKRLGDPGEAAPRISNKNDSMYERVVAIGWTVTGSGCWETNGSRSKHGYALVHASSLDGPARKTLLAHRVVFEHHHGQLGPGEVVRHSCDNPPCLNPDDLLRGTQADNVDDMWERKRGASGFRHPNTRLSEAQVLEIQKRYRAGGATHQALADEFSVSREHVGNIIRGKRRAHTA